MDYADYQTTSKQAIELAENIADYELQIADAKLEKWHQEKAAQEIEELFLDSMGGFASLGKNDSTRKDALRHGLAQTEHPNHMSRVHEYAHEILRLEAKMKGDRAMFNALRAELENIAAHNRVVASLPTSQPTNGYSSEFLAEL